MWLKPSIRLTASRTNGPYDNAQRTVVDDQAYHYARVMVDSSPEVTAGRRQQMMMMIPRRRCIVCKLNYTVRVSVAFELPTWSVMMSELVNGFGSSVPQAIKFANGTKSTPHQLTEACYREFNT